MQLSKTVNVLCQQLESLTSERISKAWELSFLGIHEVLSELWESVIAPVLCY